MNDTQLVSIIIPTYKSGSSLKASIESALNQTYSNIEVIVVDDNDPDTEYRFKTELIMKDYEKNPKVKYIKHNKNKNGAAARNTGFKYSKGDFICFLDDDDIFLETKVEKQVKFLIENNQYNAVYTWRYQNGKVISYSKNGDLSEEILTLSFSPYTSSIMVTRKSFEFINGFDESFIRHQDYEFLLRFFEFFSIGVIEEPLVEIRGNEINNALHGYKLEDLKNQFLKQFDSYIKKIEQGKKGFKRYVYAMHFSTVFWDYVLRKEFKNAIILFKKYSQLCGTVFWKSLFDVFVKKVKIKMYKLGIKKT